MHFLSRAVFFLSLCLQTCSTALAQPDSLLKSIPEHTTVLSLPESISLSSNFDKTPQAGTRVPVVSPEYVGTQVHHMLYLPDDWDRDWKTQQKRWPVIVEYTGNYFPAAGSTGKVEGAGLGYGVSGGNFIWITLPYVAENLQQNEVTWWGDIEATVSYAKTNVPRICQEFGGDPEIIFLCGFSRGAIATNFIGLHDDEIAKLWCGFITHDHYDGVHEWKGTTWGTPLTEYREAAKTRLQRIDGRPVLVCQSGSTSAVETYLQNRTDLNNFSFLKVNTQSILGEFPNEFAIHPHNDRWLLKPSHERDLVWDWVQEIIAEKKQRQHEKNKEE